MVDGDSSGQGGLTIKAVSEVAAKSSDVKGSSREEQDISGSVSDAPAACMNR